MKLVVGAAGADVGAPGVLAVVLTPAVVVVTLVHIYTEGLDG